MQHILKHSVAAVFKFPNFGWLLGICSAWAGNLLITSYCYDLQVPHVSCPTPLKCFLFLFIVGELQIICWAI